MTGLIYEIESWLSKSPINSQLSCSLPEAVTYLQMQQTPTGAASRPASPILLSNNPNALGGESYTGNV